MLLQKSSMKKEKQKRSNSEEAAEKIKAAVKDKKKPSIDLESNDIEDISALRRSLPLSLTKLNLSRNEIIDISPLKGSLPLSLKELYLNNNQIVDISPLKGSLPSSLIELNLSWNQIVDISPLKESLPSSLIFLDLSCNNQILDISPLKDSLPSSLEYLCFHSNQIVDISPLKGSLPSSLNYLGLGNNPIADVHSAACAIAFNPLNFANLKLIADDDIESMVYELGPTIQKLGPTTYSRQVPSNVIQSGPNAILSYLKQPEQPPEQQPEIKSNPTWVQVVDLLLLLEFSSQNASTIATQLDMHKYCSLKRLLHTPESVLKECGLRGGDLHVVLKWQRDNSATVSSLPKTDSFELEQNMFKKQHLTLPPTTYVLFISYVKRDTLAETGLFYSSAKEKFKNHRFFRDTEERFKLAELVHHVKQSTNVLVFLSQGYGKSPYCLVELVTAFQHHLNMITVIVHKPGLNLFNFEEMRDVLESGRVGSLLDKKGWKEVEKAGYSQQDVVHSLLAVMNVKAFPFHVDSTQRAQKAYLEDIWEGVKL